MREERGEVRAASERATSSTFSHCWSPWLGHSTFMREFLCDLLPATFRTTSRSKPKRGSARAATSSLAKGSRACSRGRTRWLVVHYDIMWRFSRRFEHYATIPP